MSRMLNIAVSDTLYETLMDTARQTGQPLEKLAAAWLAAEAERYAHDPLDAYIGFFDSSGADWADNHDYYLGQTALSNGGDDQG